MSPSSISGWIWYADTHVVVAGSPHEPMTRTIAADLERRGYIVYIMVSSADEEHLVQSEHRADIKALWLDLATVSIHDHP